MNKMKKKTKLNEVKHLQKLAGIKLNESYINSLQYIKNLYGEEYDNLVNLGFIDECNAFLIKNKTYFTELLREVGIKHINEYIEDDDKFQEFTKSTQKGTEDEEGFVNGWTSAKDEIFDFLFNKYIKQIYKNISNNPKELDENQNDEDDDEDPSAIIEKEYKSSPNEAPYNEVLEIIKSYEDDKILNIFIKKYQNKKTISKKEYLDFNKIHIDLTGDGWIFNLMNWVSIFDPTIYDRTGLI